MQGFHGDAQLQKNGPASKPAGPSEREPLRELFGSHHG